MRLKSLESESEKFSRLNTATIREVDSTESDSNFTAKETQDYVPYYNAKLQTTKQTHNFKTLN